MITYCKTTCNLWASNVLGKKLEITNDHSFAIFIALNSVELTIVYGLSCAALIACGRHDDFYRERENSDLHGVSFRQRYSGPLES